MPVMLSGVGGRRDLWCSAWRRVGRTLFGAMTLCRVTSRKKSHVVETQCGDHHHTHTHTPAPGQLGRGKRHGATDVALASLKL